jgi:hypothetical protein
MKEKIIEFLSRLDPTKGPRSKIKEAVKKILIANFLAGTAGGAVGALGASYLTKGKKDDTKTESKKIPNKKS